METASIDQRSTSTDRLVRLDAAVAIYPSRLRGFTLLLGNLLGASMFSAIAVHGLPSQGLSGWVAVHIAWVFAPVMLVCATQSAVWLIRRLPSFVLHPSGLTTFLTGFQAIRLEDAELGRVVMHALPNQPPSLAFEPVAADALRRRLSVIDRFYFDQSRRFVGFGLSYNVVLPAAEFSDLVGTLKERFGDRFESRIPGLEEAIAAPL